MGAVVGPGAGRFYRHRDWRTGVWRPGGGSVFQPVMVAPRWRCWCRSAAADHLRCWRASCTSKPYTAGARPNEQPDDFWRHAGLPGSPRRPARLAAGTPKSEAVARRARVCIEQQSAHIAPGRLATAGKGSHKREALAPLLLAGHAYSLIARAHYPPGTSRWRTAIWPGKPGRHHRAANPAHYPDAATLPAVWRVRPWARFSLATGLWQPRRPTPLRQAAV